MIFYFSGTGNSLYVSKQLSVDLNLELFSISKEKFKRMLSKETIFEYTLKDKEPIVFVFPVYSWAPPEDVLLFIDRLKLNSYNKQIISTVITCGENVGDALSLTAKRLKAKGYIQNNGFSVVMPNNYIIIGDVYSKDVEKNILSHVDENIAHISNIIKENQMDTYEVRKGAVPSLKTHIIGTLFNKSGRKTKSFFVEDHCTHCGICERVCNSKTITLVDGLPTWGKSCTQCLACINYCPVKAIQYGKGTKNKGRYVNPNISVKEMFLDN